MSAVSQEQKDLILDFYFRCGDQDNTDRGRALVARSTEAAQLCAGLGETLSNLDRIKYEPCPKNLVELTIARLNAATCSGQTQLERLLKVEEHRSMGEFTVLATAHREE
jgi:hypothetical protein